MEKIWENLVKNFVDWNSKINLSAIRNPDEIYLKHILDSIKLNDFWEIPKKSKIADIGTGGGFPLIPLAITNPDSYFVGIETRNKKVNAVNDIIKNLGIKNAKAIWSRIEDHIGTYDILTARALGMIDKIMPISYDLVKKGGIFVFYKMESKEENILFEKLIKKYKLKLISRNSYKLFENDINRVLRILQK